MADGPAPIPQRQVKSAFDARFVERCPDVVHMNAREQLAGVRDAWRSDGKDGRA
jgi:hypothetical protein